MPAVVGVAPVVAEDEQRAFGHAALEVVTGPAWLNGYRMAASELLLERRRTLTSLPGPRGLRHCFPIQNQLVGRDLHVVTADRDHSLHEVGVFVAGIDHDVAAFGRARAIDGL